MIWAVKGLLHQEEWSRVDRDFIEAEVRRYLEIQDNAGSLLKQWESEFNAQRRT